MAWPNLVAVVFVALTSLFGACASTTPLKGAVCAQRTAVFGSVGSVPRWHFADASGAVLVVFTEDGATANEELVLTLPSAEPGELAIAELAERYYQRGGQTLAYASRSLSGRLRLSGVGGRMTGSAEVVAAQPEVDVQKVGEVRRNLRFEVEVDPPMCR